MNKKLGGQGYDKKGEHMKYCNECGHEMDDDMEFCPSCGSRTYSNGKNQQKSNVDIHARPMVRLEMTKISLFDIGLVLSIIVYVILNIVKASLVFATFEKSYYEDYYRKIASLTKTSNALSIALGVALCILVIGYIIKKRKLSLYDIGLLLSIVLFAAVSFMDGISALSSEDNNYQNYKTLLTTGAVLKVALGASLCFFIVGYFMKKKEER